jgi:hypothetical protein
MLRLLSIFKIKKGKPKPQAQQSDTYQIAEQPIYIPTYRQNSDPNQPPRIEIEIISVANRKAVAMDTLLQSFHDLQMHYKHQSEQAPDERLKDLNITISQTFENLYKAFSELEQKYKYS